MLDIPPNAVKFDPSFYFEDRTKDFQDIDKSKEEIRLV